MAKLRGSDLRENPYFRVENAVLDVFNLNPYELAVYVWIARRVNNQTGVAFPSMTRLAQDANMSRRKAVDSIQRLEELGLIRVERSKSEKGRQEVNHYYLIDATKLSQTINRVHEVHPLLVHEMHCKNTNLEKDEEDSAELRSDTVQELPTTQPTTQLPDHREVQEPPTLTPVPISPSPSPTDKQRKAALREAVRKHVFGGVNGRILEGKIINWLMANTGANAATIDAFAAWYAKSSDGCAMPRNLDKFITHYEKFKLTMQQKEVKQQQTAIRLQGKLNPLTGQYE